MVTFRSIIKGMSMCVSTWCGPKSAAFDMIDHVFLLSRLRDIFGIHDQVLAWVKSYLSNRL